ncbi:hypothetical protein VCHENC02_0491B, partial [Vibrio harveyi]
SHFLFTELILECKLATPAHFEITTSLIIFTF